jgi:hypothetical protein
MPFTFSHPALILPFRYLPRSWVSFTGLIIGSIVPDFEYIVNGARTFSHTLKGAVWFDLPLGLLCAFIFHKIIRDKVILNLPDFLYRRFAWCQNFNWQFHFKKNFLIVIFSILLGIATHLLWDSFIHGTGYFIRQFPALTKIVNIAGEVIPVYESLWFVSSILGVIIIAVGIYLLQTTHAVKKNSILSFWMQIFLWTVISVCFC